MYAHVEISKDNSRTGQIVWAECTKDEFDDLDKGCFVSIVYPDGFRTKVKKGQINFYSDNRTEVEVMAVDVKKEALEKFEKCVLVLILHNADNMGPMAAFGLETSTYAEIGNMVDYICDWTKIDSTEYTCDIPVLLTQTCTEKKIPVLHITKVADGDYICYWLSTGENQFFGSGILLLPNKDDVRVILDKVVKFLNIELS